MNRTDIAVEARRDPPVGRSAFEVVERKGLGHPDSICDALMENASLALCRAYRDTCGRILHHNVDKGLLVAGSSRPDFGGGTIDAPIRVIFGDRATTRYGDRSIDVREIVEEAARSWIRDHLRFVEPDRHVVFQNELRPGSAELTGIFGRDVLVANDTSIGVGSAPLTETERLTLEAERWLNSPELKERRPEIGEDIKILAVRRDRSLHLTAAIAFVDRFVEVEAAYFELRESIRAELAAFLESRLVALDIARVHVNTLDEPGRGADGAYLTVLGTSADGADGGQVGRGNRVSGLITPQRPMSLEAAAGKNPVSHVGKIYNVLASRLAERIHERIEAVEEVDVWLASQIGGPLDQPWFASARVVLVDDAPLASVRDRIESLIDDGLTEVHTLTEELTRGEHDIC